MQDNDAATCLPSLSPALNDKFGGPHTQWAGRCFSIEASGAITTVVVVISCTQIYVCDAEALVLRCMVMQRLLSIYHRAASPDEQEALLVFDREHDLLLRGTLRCDGEPPKPLIATLRALHAAHHPAAPLLVHGDHPTPLREVAQLRPPPGYAAPLPHKEELFERCPCWREADILSISTDEFARRVRNVFIVYAPEKLTEVDEICRKYARKKGGALQYLVEKYGPEPTEEHARAVLAAHERERKFAELTAGQDSTRGSSNDANSAGAGAVPLSARTRVEKQKLTDESETFFSTLMLAKQPSGGYGRVQIRVTPIPYMLPQQEFQPFRRREHQPEQEFWYMCNEGCVLSFNISPDAMARFGYRHGDRVLATWGVTRSRWSTVVGVRDGCLWVHDDGEVGAAALAGFKDREELERFNGWMLAENVRLSETVRMPIRTADRGVLLLAIAPEFVERQFGFCHGEQVRCAAPCTHPQSGTAVVVGVDEETATLYAIFDTPENTARIRKPDAVAQPVQRCHDHSDVIRHYGWEVVGAERVFRWTQSQR